MLYGRRLDEALEHVETSRYALVHAVAKRARQITLWLTADPTELRAESAPPPTAGEIATRDPVALAENEIIQGEVRVRWDPEGLADERDMPESALLPADPLLLDTLGEEDDDFETDADADTETDDVADVPLTPALAEVIGTGVDVGDDAVDDDDSPDELAADIAVDLGDDASNVDAVEDPDDD